MKRKKRPTPKTAKRSTVTARTVRDVKQLVAALEAHHAAAQLGAAPDLCATWKLVKPLWPMLTMLVLLVPRVGRQLQIVLVKLGEANDQLCP